MKKLFLITITSFVFACQNNHSNNSDAQKADLNISQIENKEGSVEPENPEFQKYLEKFYASDLPILVKGCEEEETSLYEFDGVEFSQFIKERSFSYAQIPANGDFKATITLGLADCYLPVLTTYKLDGKVIDSKTLAVGYCGGDCGFTCEEFMTISKDFKIYVADSIKSFECDGEGNEIPETFEQYVVFKEGKLLPDGRIELSEEVKKMIE